MRTKEIEHLKRDVTTLSRLRHPCILEVVEPLEECRSSYLFATEHVVASSHELLQDSADPAHQLDEVNSKKAFFNWLGPSIFYMTPNLFIPISRPCPWS